MPKKKSLSASSSIENLKVSLKHNFALIIPIGIALVVLLAVIPTLVVQRNLTKEIQGLKATVSELKGEKDSDENVQNDLRNRIETIDTKVGKVTNETKTLKDKLIEDRFFENNEKDYYYDVNDITYKLHYQNMGDQEMLYDILICEKDKECYNPLPSISVTRVTPESIIEDFQVIEEEVPNIPLPFLNVVIKMSAKKVEELLIPSKNIAGEDNRFYESLSRRLKTQGQSKSVLEYNLGYGEQDLYVDLRVVDNFTKTLGVERYKINYQDGWMNLVGPSAPPQEVVLGTSDENYEGEEKNIMETMDTTEESTPTEDL